MEASRNKARRMKLRIVIRRGLLGDFYARRANFVEITSFRGFRDGRPHNSAETSACTHVQACIASECARSS